MKIFLKENLRDPRNLERYFQVSKSSFPYKIVGETKRYLVLQNFSGELVCLDLIDLYLEAYQVEVNLEARELNLPSFLEKKLDECILI